MAASAVGSFRNAFLVSAKQNHLCSAVLFVVVVRHLLLHRSLCKRWSWNAKDRKEYRDVHRIRYKVMYRFQFPSPSIIISNCSANSLSHRPLLDNYSKPLTCDKLKSSLIAADEDEDEPEDRRCCWLFAFDSKSPLLLLSMVLPHPGEGDMDVVVIVVAPSRDDGSCERWWWGWTGCWPAADWLLATKCCCGWWACCCGTLLPWVTAIKLNYNEAVTYLGAKLSIRRIWCDQLRDYTTGVYQNAIRWEWRTGD